MKSLRHPVASVLVLVIRAYQTFVSPALRPSCRYYPSCSQYAIDALRRFGILRGLVLAGWRLLRCNPWSRGGYDPVERQTLFGGRVDRERTSKPGLTARAWRPTRIAPPLVLLLLAVLVLMMPVATASCSFFGTTTTTTPGATGASDVTTSQGAETTTTTVAPEEEHPGSFDKLSKPLQALFFWVLDFLHGNLGVSWSWAIVLLTVIIRIILIPLTWRQIKSMRAMQALQPQLKALQEKYKDNRQLLNQKVMEFYQQNNVSPFGSCLPLLLQLPVFLGLFYMLRTAGRTGLDPAEWGRWASVFVDPQVGWLWISDITRFNIILMFLYIASQFLASWQMARKTGGQQKMIAYIMPIVVGVFMYIYKWPAGLMIYWFTSNLWTIAQQYVAERLLPIHVPVGVAPDKEKAATGQTGKTPAKTGAKTTAPVRKAPPKGAGKVSSPPAGKAATKAGKGTFATTAEKTSAQSAKKTPAPAGKAPAKGGGARPPASTGKSGGVTSGQETGQKRETAGSASQRPDGGAGGAESSGGT